MMMTVTYTENRTFQNAPQFFQWPLLARIQPTRTMPNRTSSSLNRRLTLPPSFFACCQFHLVAAKKSKILTSLHHYYQLPFVSKRIAF
jgi:hypothetical protein